VTSDLGRRYPELVSMPNTKTRVVMHALVPPEADAVVAERAIKKEFQPRFGHTSGRAGLESYQTEWFLVHNQNERDQLYTFIVATIDRMFPGVQYAIKSMS
jgi:hypothetical protein